MEFTCNKHSADCPSLTNFHCNSHHRGTVLGVLSFIAMRWLSSPSLNYLSDSPGRPTVEALGLSFLTLTSHLLQLGCDARVGGGRGVSFWTHLLPYLFTFSFLSPNLHFSSLLSYRLTSGSGHFSKLSQLWNSHPRSTFHPPMPQPFTAIPPHPISPPFSLPGELG